MLTLVIILLAVWLILAIIGFALEGLAWLGVIGIVLFVATVIIGFVRRSVNQKKRSATS
ncbi:MAG TPA: hypothetical protein VFZ85_00865 [Jiangellaceae bacterium]